MSRSNALSRRRFLGLAGGTLAGGVLAACAPTVTEPTAAQPAAAQPTAAQPAAAQPTTAPAVPAAPTAAPAAKEGVTFAYWVGWPNHGDIYEGFQKTAEFTEMLGVNKIDFRDGVKRDVLLTNIAAGTPPDAHSGNTYMDAMSRGVLLPIEDMVAASKYVKQADFIAAAWDRCNYKGVQYGVPANECFLEYGLNYNSKLVADAGLDPDKPPTTWAEAFEWHKTLTKFGPSGNLVQIGLDPYDAVGGSIGLTIGYMPGASWGTGFFDAEARKFTLDTPETAEALEMLGEFIKVIGPDNLVGMRSVEGQGTWGGAYNAGVQAMIIEGYWHPGETHKDKPEVSQYNRATWLPVPDARRGKKAQYAGGHMVMFFKEGKNAVPAFFVAEWLQTKTALDVLFNTNGWLPARQSYLDSVDPSVYPGLDFYFKSAKEADSWLKPVKCEIDAFVSTKFQEMREAVFRSNMTGKEAAAAWQKACDDEWKATGMQ